MAQIAPGRWSTHITAALSGTAAGQLVSGIAQVLIVRTLGVAGYGQYAYVYAWLAIVSSLLGAGLDTWLLDAQSRNSENLSQSVRRLILIKSIVWVGCLVGALSGLTSIPRVLLVSGMLVILGDSFASTGFQLLRGQNRHTHVALLLLIGPVIMLGAVLSGVTTTVQQLVWVQLGGAAIAVCAIAGSLHPSARLVPAATTRILSGAIPFVVSDICAQLYTQSTTIIIGNQMAQSAVGIYRGAWSLVGYSFIVPAVLFQTTLPHLNADARPTARRYILQRTGVLFLLYATLMGGFVVYGAPVILPRIYGEAFAASARLLPAFALIPLCKAMSFYAILILLMQKQITRRIMVQIMVVMIVWATAPWFIRTAGIDGAVTAQLISEGVLGFGYLLVAAFSLCLTEPTHTPPRRLVVTNMHGMANLGDAAIHEAQVAIFARAFPNVQPTLFCALPEEVRLRFPEAMVLRGVHSWVYGADGRIAPLRTRMRRQLVFACMLLVGRWMPVPRWGVTPDEYATLQALQTADIVCMSGGGYLYDAPARHPWLRLLQWDWWILADILLAIAWRRPFILLPQSIGPCHNRHFARLVRWTFARAQHITVRDSTSAALLSRWGIAHRCAPDLAWSVPVPVSTTEQHAPILGVSALDWGAQYPSFTGQTRYEDALVETLIEYASRGWRIQLFSQCRESQPAWNDRLVSQRIAARVGPAAALMPDYETPSALAAAYAAVDCLIATRMHAAILRMRSAGSCVVIGYLPKSAGLMADMGLAPWHIPIHAVSSALLRAAIETRAQQRPLLVDALRHIDEQRARWVDDLAAEAVIQAE